MAYQGAMLQNRMTLVWVHWWILHTPGSIHGTGEQFHLACVIEEIDWTSIVHSAGQLHQEVLVLNTN